MKILIVDDEEDIAGLIQFHLEEEGFQTEVCHNGMEVLPRLEKNLPDGIILDLMLPGIGGMDLCKRIKEKYPQIPILMVTAKTGETDVVLGLELGADDYIRKPFNIRELVARVRSVTRRTTDPSQEVQGTITTGKIQINPTAHKVFVEGTEIDLTLIEFKLLQLFAGNPGVAFSRDKLLDRIWGKDVFVTDRTVDVNIKRLRDKLLSEKERLETIRGVGYRFRDA
ncbi:DNA-binding response regulator [Leptospira biflexa]|jgi:two-component system alkaline phosphatase synthesis response regulator PhoP|uniref:Phosphate regulon transcriptional regulatory protein PhoB n=1 Tax=Leptospira biflexa serovar Patoc (strain Patoc 1 / ATCC 23582 / Paris) TaxID=456481 RepID=B0SQP4_LEPBP|nr:response regulator transcription factor [Leptospira biflexa]ABZ95583.1 Response regulator [Leptospira biflexa serovar Patoc strain 'Patoc 1 (Ames)']ABZ99291.1 Putative response regulator receiver, transcriptional regulatory protein (C-terminal) [Leptospira biflexa serovar Patoc strain 'Patoc 1 (Paris)']TGM35891.1 DNA-binding response regulator [Leptospira biflexa]TGM37261.1 DNA-binding response regulator [Leptospira biflexa]TGM46801.1 DNA-binding response regulator [Leptospira biflexa]